MADIGILESLVRPFVMDCPSLLVKVELQRAAREFFEETRTWHETLTATIVDGALQSMELMPSNATVVALVEVRDTASNKVLTKMDSVESLLSADAPDTVSMHNAVQLVISNAPNSASLDVTFSAKLTIGSSEVPSHLLEKWGDIIARGATAGVMLHHNGEWYNQNDSIYHRDAFMRGITSARTQKAAGFSNANMRASGLPFI